jgi:polysaccharide deacetylase family protein (PEP-CTERM system associated)
VHPLLLSFDFEDWHQLVHRRLGVADWDVRGEALERQTATTLDLLDELDAKATFFLLGITARRYPDLVREIVARGHEPASHGFGHERIHRQTEDEFRRDVEASAGLIEETAGRRPVAYRAPAFSINRNTPWAYDVLAAAGFRYDSSQYDSPRVPNRIGAIPQAPYRLELAGGAQLWELPVSVVQVGGRRVPIGGGSYWKLLPQPLLLRALRRAARLSAHPVLYFHPYECDPEPLRARLPSRPSWRQRLTAAERSGWRNLRREAVPARLRSVAREFRLLSYEQAYDEIDEYYGTRTRSLSREGVLVRPPLRRGARGAADAAPGALPPS